jgi:hypothetical protein
MYAFQLASVAAPTGAFAKPASSARTRFARQLRPSGPRLGEAAKAGLGVALSSAIILAAAFAVLATLPIGIG